MLKNIRILMLCILIFFMSIGCSSNEPNDTIQSTIKQSVKSLEQKNYSQFLDKHLHPRDLKKALKSSNRKKFIKEFSVKASVTMLNALRSIKDIKPKLSHNKNAATFTVKRYNRKLVLVKHKNNWFIINSDNPSSYLK